MEIFSHHSKDPKPDLWANNGGSLIKMILFGHPQKGPNLCEACISHIKIFEYKYMWRDRNVSSTAGMIERISHIKIFEYWRLDTKWLTSGGKV